MNIIIFAGGQGTRLWPASRESKPKQFLKLVGDKTLLEQTYERLKPVFLPKNIFVATSKKYTKIIQKQLPNIPKSNFSLEPARKDRGPALGLAIINMLALCKNQDIFATAWSDDYIKQPKKYLSTLHKAERLIRKNPNQIIAIGAKVTSPSTAFCYIEVGSLKSNDLMVVNKFTEKPSIKEANKYFRSNNYFWNTGYFVASGSFILELYKKYYPKNFALLEKMTKGKNQNIQQKLVDELYPKLREFDFEDIFRKDPSMLKVLEGDFGWADVGRWSVIKDIQSGDLENLTQGEVLQVNTSGSLIYNYKPNQLLTTLNVKDLIIVNTDEAILIANKNSSEELKLLINKIRSSKKHRKFL